MKKNLLILSFMLCVGLDPTPSAFAQPSSSVDLVNNSKNYDGQTVTYEGEIIGDIMVRGENAWINVNDGSNAIGVWTTREMTREIFKKGSYRTRGDTLRIEGIFHRSCPEHGGDLDIHARSWTQTSPGCNIPERPDPHKRDLAFGLTIGALLLGLITKRRTS
jgi:hypothetical protein